MAAGQWVSTAPGNRRTPVLPEPIERKRPALATDTRIIHVTPGRTQGDTTAAILKLLADPANLPSETPTVIAENGHAWHGTDSRDVFVQVEGSRVGILLSTLTAGSFTAIPAKLLTVPETPTVHTSRRGGPFAVFHHHAMARPDADTIHRMAVVVRRMVAAEVREVALAVAAC